MSTTSSKNWYMLSVEKVLSLLETSKKGLSEKEVISRQAKYGPNRLPKAKTPNAFQRFFSQFKQVLIYILLVAAAISFFLQEWLNGLVILGVVFIDSLIGFFQEGKAEKALEAVYKMLSLENHVIRDEKHTVILAKNLVPGDIVLLRPGDKVPADLRLISDSHLEINEMILTGESFPVEKNNQPLSENTVINDQKNMAFAGTLVTSGRGMGVVVRTGEKTEMGHITQLLRETHRLTTPLLKKISHFSKVLSAFILSTVALLFLFGLLYWNYPIEEMLVIAVGIAVSAIPEGLPIILTVTLAIGVKRMAERNAIIRHLPAVEALGSVTVICTDKTGTLTKNEMTATSVIMKDFTLKVSGTGYTPIGEFYKDCKSFIPYKHKTFHKLCRAIMLCNETHFEKSNNSELILRGDPTEGALLMLAMKADFDIDALQKELPLTDMIPFESKHRLMATLHHDHHGNGSIYIKGAPETILNRCNLAHTSKGNQSIDLDYWEKEIEKIVSNSERALAIAFKPFNSKDQTLNFSDIENDFVLLGVIGIMDPPREEARGAIEECLSAGVQVKMMTGDHSLTAATLAKSVGIHSSESVLRGKEIDQLSPVDFAERIETTHVFARTTAHHKLQLVEALQAKGHVVAMTGDGINDAPALKRAEIGVAMGLQGTETAKEASEIVLMDDNFKSIVSAIKEGRTVFDNIKKVLLFLLPINAGEAGSLILATIFGITQPITPLQILWVNLVSSVLLTMSLAFEPAEKNIMQRKPIPIFQPLWSHLLTWRIILVGILFLIGIFGSFVWALNQGLPLETSRTIAVNMLVSLEVWTLLSVRYMQGSSLSFKNAKLTKSVLIAIILVCLCQAALTYAPFMQYLFNTAALSFNHWIMIIAVGIFGFLFLEMDKLIFRWRVGRKKK